MAFDDINPFARTSQGQVRNITAYRVTTILSWLLLVITSIAYTVSAPNDGKYAHHTIFGQSNAHKTPFTLSHVFVSIYWIVLYIWQVIYVSHLYRADSALVATAATVGSHFILFNLLQFAWIMLWVRSHFVWSEVIAIINFFNIVAVYYRNPAAPRLIHLPVSVLPLTFLFFLIFWNGAVMVHCHGVACRVLANVTIWGQLVFPAFFLLAFKDMYVGFATAFLAAGEGVGQFFTKVIALQWIFAFVIMGVVAVGSTAFAVPGFFGARAGPEERTGDDRERAPLLQDA